MTDTPWLTAAQAAEYLQVHRDTIYDWYLSGVIPAIRIGKGRGRLRFDRDDLDRVMRDNKMPGPAPAPPKRKRRRLSPADLQGPDSFMDALK
jgi:excisionase family DNA binding protein